jgi:7,8-dihydropterin-6-yl-methyl-4-(beta-D-ribofuranosyl)aminobenzene 5'-phosphate synthase
MKLKVLCDNNTIIDRYYLGEPGIALLIEVDGKQILLDTGYSDVFLRNAHIMGIDLRELDFLAISHGHDDHTGGLSSLLKYYEASHMQKTVELVAHPGSFATKVSHGREIGLNLREFALTAYFKLNKTKEPFQLTDRLTYLGEIPRRNDFENKIPIGSVQNAQGQWVPDFLADDTALAYRSDEGLVIITGCSHSGICNIIEHAKTLCGETRIADVIGGFHLLDTPPDLMARTLQYLSAQSIRCMHPCHCTDLQAKIALSKVLRVEETGVGAVYTY